MLRGEIGATGVVSTPYGAATVAKVSKTTAALLRHVRMTTYRKLPLGMTDSGVDYEAMERRKRAPLWRKLKKYLCSVGRAEIDRRRAAASAAGTPRRRTRMSIQNGMDRASLAASAVRGGLGATARSVRPLDTGGGVSGDDASTSGGGDRDDGGARMPRSPLARRRPLPPAVAARALRDAAATAPPGAAYDLYDEANIRRAFAGRAPIAPGTAAPVALHAAPRPAGRAVVHTVPIPPGPREVQSRGVPAARGAAATLVGAGARPRVALQGVDRGALGSPHSPHRAETERFTNRFGVMLLTSARERAVTATTRLLAAAAEEEKGRGRRRARGGRAGVRDAEVRACAAFGAAAAPTHVRRRRSTLRWWRVIGSRARWRRGGARKRRRGRRPTATPRCRLRRQCCES